ncbi:S1C family serine protease [Natrialbaceae archaeon AArc-T1-2]|uniref:S1C family serine protease n=1 Tax=Natrialbaceae archaeon AArc-T1-2 TaxID=3053904 RepID=UPI00255AFBE4|nr:S1C family serine protease [Natrialbaceae archaeon AArc-T1-2]WIV66813.1 S1C family serine protease [Natrialbaceae archaeon AArc-T1-2]
MDERTFGRREFLGAAGAMFLGSVAGCTEPHAGTSFEAGDDDPIIDTDDRVDGSVYTDIYEATIDSVTLVRVLGVDDPFGDQGQGQGSAFLYDERHVVTNEHVIGDGAEVDLQYVNGDWTSTEIVGTDFHSDLAVLEVDHVPDAAEPLSLLDQHPAVGQEVLAIGNPLGLEGSMTKGIVSGVDRSPAVPGTEFQEPRQFPHVVQFDAAVNPGNSGGPLVDMDGDVVGVVNAGGGDNIGFAISAALTSRVVPSLVETGEYRHPYVGFIPVTVDRIVAEENGLDEPTGVIVAEVEPETPADGVLEESQSETRRHGSSVPIGGDVVLAIDGEPIPNADALSTYLSLEASPGDDVEIEIRRDGDRRTVELTLGERPQNP